MVWLGALVPAALLLRYSAYGRSLDAVGSNPQAAALSGLPHLRVVFAGHVASALVSVLNEASQPVSNDTARLIAKRLVDELN